MINKVKNNYMLNVDKVASNWDIFLERISNLKRKNLLEFYTDNEDRFILMPASGKLSYHNCFGGGYIDHVLRVRDCAEVIFNHWKQMGATIDFTLDELNFVALNHDIGKFGDDKEEYYLPNPSDWHIKNRGEVYTHNPKLSFMKTSDRSLFLLQKLGVELSETEFLSIKLHDGLFEESNKSYYVAYSDDYRIRSNLPYIIHQADMMSARIEYDLFQKSNSNGKSQTKQLKNV